MKTTDFAHSLSAYLSMYLPGQRGLSENTIMAYRDTFKLVLHFAEKEKNLCAEKMTLADFNSEFITEFVTWLEKIRGCSVATCNQRLATLRAFAKYARGMYPEFLHESQKIMDTKAKKKVSSVIPYLSADGIKHLLAQPNRENKYGRRDLVLLSLMYDSAARVQEICDLKVRDVRLEKPFTVILTGKGRKTRFVPLMSSTGGLIAEYFKENNLHRAEKHDDPLFCNHQQGKLTRAGVAYILNKYFELARKDCGNLPPKISPHMLRHSKAMHLLQAGVNIVYIRDFLGHVNVSTTEVYAKCDTEMKRNVLEQASVEIDSALPEWTNDKDLMSMLIGLCGKG